MVNKKDYLIIYFSIFILIIVIILFFVLDQDDDDPNDKFSYEDLSSFSKFGEKVRDKSNFRKPSVKKGPRHPVIDYQKKASYRTVPATLGDPIRPLNVGAGPSNNQNRDPANGNPANGNSLDIVQQHPVLEYQRNSYYGVDPATWGDSIRPSYPGASPSPSNYIKKEDRNENSYAYELGRGPYPGDRMGVPVRRENMKSTNEYHKAPFYNNMNNNNMNNNNMNNNNMNNNNMNNNLPFDHQNNPLHSYDYFKPYGPNQTSMQSEINYVDTPFYNNYNNHNGNNSIPFISSVDSFAPFPEVQSNWEKSGMIQTVDPSNTEIMNIYRKAIAPLRDIFEYSVQDKNGFVVPLKETYLEDGDIIHSIPGREALGKWRYNDYVRYKYVWH
jgi:hypothetical protein